MAEEEKSMKNKSNSEVNSLCEEENVVNDGLDWDKTTINNNCYNRKQRRAFITITSSTGNNWYEAK